MWDWVLICEWNASCIVRGIPKEKEMKRSEQTNQEKYAKNTIDEAVWKIESEVDSINFNTYFYYLKLIETNYIDIVIEMEIIFIIIYR